MEDVMSLKSMLPIGRDRQLARREHSPFGSLQREIDRVFDEFAFGFKPFATPDLMPSMDVAETDKEIEILAELPGLEDNDVQVNIADNVLTIRGEKRVERKEKDKDYRLVERSYGSFSRSLELPAGVNPDAVRASITKGVLKVTVPKPAPAQVKKVEIKSAA
jgi:HSP20 family protein